MKRADTRPPISARVVCGYCGTRNSQSTQGRCQHQTMASVGTVLHKGLLS